jgi:membrane protease subunit (stomatin/prohibitin family)
MLRQLVGTDPQFRTDEVESFLRDNMVSEVATAINTSGVAAIDLQGKQQELGGKLSDTLTSNLTEFGIRIPVFKIASITFPPEIQSAFEKRAQMTYLGNLDQYAKFQAANAMEAAAGNPGGAGEGLGLGLGVGLGQQMANALSPQQGAPAATAPAAPAAAPPPLPTPDKPWFIAVGGQQVGPVPLDQLPGKVTAGELTRDTLVWQEGLAAWTAAKDVPQMAGLFAAVPPPLPPA